jgi:hypothetical protein
MSVHFPVDYAPGNHSTDPGSDNLKIVLSMGVSARARPEHLLHSTMT